MRLITFPALHLGVLRSLPSVHSIYHSRLPSNLKPIASLKAKKERNMLPQLEESFVCCNLAASLIVQGADSFNNEVNHFPGVALKGVAIALLDPQHLSQPLTIKPLAGSDETVLFCRVWRVSHIVKALYGEGTNWNQVAPGRSRARQTRTEHAAPDYPSHPPIKDLRPQHRLDAEYE